MEDTRTVTLELGALGGLVIFGHPTLRISNSVGTARVAINTGNRDRKLIHEAMVRGPRPAPGRPRPPSATHENAHTDRRV